MHRFHLAAALPLALLIGCATGASDLSVEDELTLSSISGEEEDLRTGEGDFTGEGMDRGGDVDRPALFRECDAEGFLARLEARYDSNEDGEVAGAPEENAVWGERSRRDAFSERRRAHRWHRIVRIYDVDEDGEVGKTERAELLADFTERCEAIHARILEEFDVDGNGELDEDERAAAQAAREEAREERRGGCDRDGDGELSREERRTLMEERRMEIEERRAECVAAYDVDGDGEWNELETDTWRADMRFRITTGAELRCTDDTDG